MTRNKFEGTESSFSLSRRSLLCGGAAAGAMLAVQSTPLVGLAANDSVELTSGVYQLSAVRQ